VQQPRLQSLIQAQPVLLHAALVLTPLLLTKPQATVGWRFFQPFQGGTAFVATQAAGWILTAASLASMLWLGCQVRVALNRV